MRWLVFVEQHAGRPAQGGVGILSWAAMLGDPAVDAVVCGKDAAAAAARLGAFGASRVHVVEDERMGRADSDPCTDVLSDLLASEPYELVLFDTTILTSAVAAAVAVRLDCGLNWDVTEITRKGTELEAVRFALGDSVVVRAGWKGGSTRLALMRPNVHTAVPVSREGVIASRASRVRERSCRVTVLERAPYDDVGGRPIEDETVLVGAGCGVRARQDLELLRTLADALGGGLASTLPLADRRWVPYTSQVGQTGKTVAPRLYLACGISGAVQHRVGMQGAETIIAVNTDPGAPIFDHCDLGIVGDLYEFIPALLERLGTS